MDRPLPPIVYAIGGDGASLTVAASQHVDFSGAKMLSPSEAGKYRVVTPLVADAEARAMQFQRSTKEAQKADRPRDDENTGDPLRDFIAWVVAAREDLAEWNPAAPNRDDSRSPSGLIEEHRRQQQRALDSGADARIVQGVELKAPAAPLARDAEGRLIRAILAGQKVRIG